MSECSTELNNVIHRNCTYWKRLKSITPHTNSGTTSRKTLSSSRCGFRKAIIIKNWKWMKETKHMDHKSFNLHKNCIVKVKVQSHSLQRVILLPSILSSMVPLGKPHPVAQLQPQAAVYMFTLNIFPSSKQKIISRNSITRKIITETWPNKVISGRIIW